MEVLEAGAWTCWISNRDVVPGKDHGESIHDAINVARGLVLSFSKAAGEAPHVLWGGERAVSCRLPVIPFRAEGLVHRNALEYVLSSPH